MLKNLAPLFFTAAGVASAGAVGYVLVESGQFNGPSQEISAPAPNEQAASKPQGLKVETENKEEKQSVASLPDASEQAAEPVQEPSAVLPRFEVLRVEKDGSTVIAGIAQPDSRIEIMDAADSNRIVGEGTALASGDYAIVLEKPLSAGRHELYIISTLKNGEKLQSADAGLVEVPEASSDGGPIVIVSTPDAPTRVLQAPETEVASKVEEDTQIAALEKVEPSMSTEEPVQQAAGTPDANSVTDDNTAVSEPDVVEAEQPPASAVATEPDADTTEPDSEISQTEEVLEEQEASEPESVVAKAEPQDDTPQAAKVVKKPILIQAADVESGKVYIAGVGEPGDTVNIYVGEDFLGSATIAGNGSFLFEGDYDLKPGRYPIRADMVEPGTTDVLARAEVSLLHQPEVDVAATVADQSPETSNTTVDNVETPPQPTAETQDSPSNQIRTDTGPDTVEDAETTEPVKPDMLQAGNTQTPKTEIAQVDNAVDNDNPSITEIRTGSSVIIRRGDSLWRVARRSYGAGIRFTTIFEANRDQVRNPHLIYPGQVLKVPEEARADADSDAG
ncbi:MAG: LysM peptidoglycan-binding domain-containing protein [Rhizobiaceae bacterium]|nr:LysM peptidoglycan-binding domain-containing protein [Rhizobiaceae bacterium]